MKKNTPWTVIKVATVLLCVFAFSPFVLSPADHTPYIIGMPFSLGVGIIISLGLIVLVILGAYFAPPTEDEKEE